MYEKYTNFQRKIRRIILGYVDVNLKNKMLKLTAKKKARRWVGLIWLKMETSG
jgi:L-rhamnose mutarotase